MSLASLICSVQNGLAKCCTLSMSLQASIQPGGTVSFEHRNIKGLNRSLLGTITMSNFLNPQASLA